MKKICFIATTSVTIKTFILDTAKYLYQNGDYDITFICSKDNDFYKYLPSYIKFIPVKMKRGIDFGALGTILKLIKIFKSEKFDLVQYCTPNASLYASIAAKLAKVPIRLYCQWGIRYVGLSGFIRKLFKKFEKISCKNATHIRGVSRKNIEFSIDEGLYSEEKVYLLGNGGTIGVDLNAFDIRKRAEFRAIERNTLNISDDEFVFGFVGRLSRDKGSNELIKAFKDIHDDYKCKLLLIGSVEPQNGFDIDLYNWARDSKDIIFLGNVNNIDLPKYYSAMDCYVHPSYREGFGLVIQEAGAMGCSIITTDIAGASEVMENNDSCLLCKSQSVASLRSAMIKLLTDNDFKMKIAKNAYLRTKDLYNREVMQQRLLNDYKRLLND